MRKILVPALVTATLAVSLTGCGGRQSTQPNPSANYYSEWYAVQDNRLYDLRIVNGDQELVQGDAGIARALSGEMTKVYPNYNIPPQNGNYVNNVISFAKLFLGYPYQYGSDRSDPSSFDCSDFTRYAYLGALGMDIPKDSRSQKVYTENYGNRYYTNLRSAQPGDLLFFSEYRGPGQDNYENVDPASARITHTGICLGDGYIIHTASQATGGVRIDYMYGKHLEWRFVGGGSIIP